MPGYRGGSSLFRAFLFSILFLLQIAAQLSAGQSVIIRDGNSIRCYSFHCGDGVQIRYPLWNSSDSGTGYCGYPDLGIDCQDGHPVLRLGDDTYRISGINYNTSTITLVDGDLLGSNCPRARHNLTLREGGALAKTDADGHLLFFFNCSSGGSLGDENKISCLPRNGSKGNYVLPPDQGGGIPPETSYPQDCEEVVNSTVLATAVRLILGTLLSSFGEVLHLGFQLKWQPPYTTICVNCERKGGSCGYAYNKDARTYDLLCICNNGRHAASCSSTGQPAGTLPDRDLYSSGLDRTLFSPIYAYIYLDDG